MKRTLLDDHPGSRNLTREEVLALKYWDSVMFDPRPFDYGLDEAIVAGHVRISRHDSNIVEVPLRYGDGFYEVISLDETLKRLFVKDESK
jgi:hypothetical protein